MDSPISYSLSAGVATIAMDDGKANVMSVRMLDALSAAVDRAEADKAVVILTGRNGMFSGGFDLAVFKREPEEQLRMLTAGAKLTARLMSFPHPVVAACTGHAIAMGAFLLLSADLRIGVAEGARIQVNEVQIGLTLPRFAIEVCRQRLAPAHLNVAAITAQPYSPQQAVLAGFLDEAVPADVLASHTRTHAERLLTLHRESFAATKLRLRRLAIDAVETAIREDIADWSSRILEKSNNQTKS
jgi:enoyl-CoA hydratase